MLNILNPLESADGNQMTIPIGQQQISLVGTGFEGLHPLYQFTIGQWKLAASCRSLPIGQLSWWSHIKHV